MLIIETLPLLRQHIRRARQEGKRIALVPTMGNLHDGHMKLVDEARARADIVVVSIFVNPMQFDRADDLARYPRTLQEDCEKLKNATRISFSHLHRRMFTRRVPKRQPTLTSRAFPPCSKARAARAISAAFPPSSASCSALVQPDVACFGEKDFQQLALIRKMVADMGYDIEIVGVPIVRAKDGLALSSRNGYLTAEQRKIAPGLSKVMNTMAEQMLAKELTAEEIIALAEQALNDKGLRADDVQIRDADTLLELTQNSKRAVIPGGGLARSGASDRQ